MITDDALVDRLVRRLAANLLAEEQLLNLLRQVAAGHQLTNREGNAVILIPERVLAEIFEALGYTT